jgi:hypothetical protein
VSRRVVPHQSPDALPLPVPQRLPSKTGFSSARIRSATAPASARTEARKLHPPPETTSTTRNASAGAESACGPADTIFAAVDYAAPDASHRQSRSQQKSRVGAA